MTEAFILSNFDTHLMLSDYKQTLDSTKIDAVEYEDIINIDLGEITKDVKQYKTLTNDGWDSLAVLGQSIGDITIEFVRNMKGVYIGSSDEGTTPYEVFKKWYDSSLSAAAGTQKKNLYIAKPRYVDLGSPAVATKKYEIDCYHVIPKNWTPGPIDPDNGQTFSITLAAFGAPQQATEKSGSSHSSGTWEIVAAVEPSA